MLFDNAYCDCADLISLFHVVFVASNLLGLLLVLIGGVAGWKWVRNPWFRGIHLGMAAIVAFEAAIAYECACSAVNWRPIFAKAGPTSKK